MNSDLTLLVTIGTHGDVLPFAALGEALARFSGPVMLLSNSDHQALARDHGLDFIAIAPPLPPHDGPEAKRAFFTTSLPAFERSYAVIQHLRPRNRLRVVAHDLALGAISAAEALDLPCVTIVLAPCGLDATRTSTATALRELPDDDEQQAVAAFRAVRGLTPLDARRGAEHLPAALTVAFYSKHFAPPRASCPKTIFAGFPFAADRAPLDSELRAFLHEAPAPVVFTPGTGVAFVDDFFRAAREACRRLSLRAVFLHRNAPGDDDGGAILTRAFAPLGLVLPYAKLIVHHGGVGTMAQALRAGVPQIVLPRLFDQPDNALRAQALGVAAVLSSSQVDGEELADAIDFILGNRTFHLRARAMADRLAGEDGIVAAAGAISAAFSRQSSVRA